MNIEDQPMGEVLRDEGNWGLRYQRLHLHTDVLRWELEAIADGTLLTFTTWLGKDIDIAKDAAASYHVCLDQLIELLDTGIVGPLEDADVHRWEERYSEAVAAVQTVDGDVRLR
jgi:hypothetical protein